MSGSVKGEGPVLRLKKGRAKWRKETITRNVERDILQSSPEKPFAKPSRWRLKEGYLSLLFSRSQSFYWFIDGINSLHYNSLRDLFTDIILVVSTSAQGTKVPHSKLPVTLNLPPRSSCQAWEQTKHYSTSAWPQITRLPWRITSIRALTTNTSSILSHLSHEASLNNKSTLWHPKSTATLNALTTVVEDFISLPCLHIVILGVTLSL